MTAGHAACGFAIAFVPLCRGGLLASSR
jgi:hypothetical protein